MGIVVSGVTFTRRDVNGNRWVETWATVEFRDPLSGYRPGGESFDFTVSGGAGMRRIERLLVTPVSGVLNPQYIAQANFADFPGNAGSGRLTVHALLSGAVDIISGISVSGIRANVIILGT